MTAKFTRTHMALGSFEIEFRALPDLVSRFVPFTHIAFDYGTSRKFIGVITEIDRSDDEKIVVRGAGPEWWLGTDDKKGPVRNPKTYTSQRTDQIATDLLLRNDSTHALSAGTLHTGNTIPTFAVNYETCRRGIQRLALNSLTEYRCNTDFTFDWAGNSNLFQTRSLVFSAQAGTTKTISYTPTNFDIASKVIALGNGQGDKIKSATATATLPAAWKDWNDIAFERDLVVDAPTADDTAAVTAYAASLAGLKGQTTIDAKAELARIDLLTQFDLGDTVYVYKPQILEDATSAIAFQGEIYPAIALRVGELDVSAVGAEFSIIHRDATGAEADITTLAMLSPTSTCTVRLCTNDVFFVDLNASVGATTTSNRTDPQTLSTDSVSSDQIVDASISGADIADGALELRNFPGSIGPISVVSSLPALPDSAYPQGYFVFLTTDAKLYRNTDGSHWSRAVDGNDLIANTVQTGALNAGIVTADKLVVGDFGNLFENPSFELANDTHSYTGFAKTSDVTNARTGSYVAESTGTGTISVKQDHGVVPARQGDDFYAECYAKSTSGAGGTLHLYLAWYTSAGTLISRTSLATMTANTTYQLVSGGTTGTTGVAPASTAFAAVEIEVTSATGTWYVDDVFLHKRETSAYIADAAIITEKVADAAITNLKVNDVAANKITVGNLLATVTVTSGKIQTNSSGPRIQLTQASGIDAYAPVGRTDAGNPEDLDFWRDGSTDTTPFASFHGAHDASSDNIRDARVFAQQTDFALNYGRVILAVTNNVYAYLNYLLVQKPRSGVNDDAFRVGTQQFGTVFAAADHPFGASTDYVTWAYTPLRLFGAGLIYENGTTVASGTVTAGSSVNTAVTYGTAWPAAAPTADCLVTMEDITGTSQFHVFCDTRSQSGCTVKIKNHDPSASGTCTALAIPIIS